MYVYILYIEDDEQESILERNMCHTFVFEESDRTYVSLKPWGILEIVVDK